MKLLRYIQGLRKGKDAHRIERDAMTDSFLADALDGFDEVDGNHAERIERMQRRIAQLSQKDHHMAAARAAAKKAVLSEVVMEDFSAEACDEKEMLVAEPIKSEAPIVEKKKRRSLVVWLAAAAVLLFIATGGYFWLLKEEPVAPQLAATTEKVQANEDTTPIAEKDTMLGITDTEKLAEGNAEAIVQDARESTAKREQQATAQAAPSPVIPPPPAIAITGDEQIMAEAKTDAATESFNDRLAIDSVLDLSGFRLLDTSSSTLFAHKEIEEIQHNQSIPTSALDLGNFEIHSNTNRQALSQSQALSGKASGVQIRGAKKVETTDPHALSQWQINAQGKIGGKLADQSQVSASKNNRKKQMAESTGVSSSSAFIAPSQSGTITGRITDQYGEPLIGVTVAVKGTTTATATDMEGYFALNAKNAEKLVASYIGFDQIELPADTTKPMTIAMNESVALLDEMVVVAYGRNVADEDYSYQSPTTPQPEMGDSAYRSYLNSNMIRPTDECANVKGRVVLNFYVDSSGRPYNIEVRRSLCPSADQEAIRLVREGGRWTTGDGQARLSIKF